MRPRHGKGSKKIEIQELEAGIDWITFYPEGAEAQQAALALADEVQEADVANGSRRDRFHFDGRSGWRTASMGIGFGPKGPVLQSSSGAAESIATRLRPLAGRTTRLDVQVTCSLSKSVPHFATRSLSLSPGKREQRPSCRARIGLSSASDGSCIGTAGQRTDPRYFRVYDKGVEQDECNPGYKWRIELEAKKQLARRTWESFKETKDVQRWCYSWCEAHWKRLGLSWLLPESDALPVAVAAPRKMQPPAEAIERWLIASVRPTVPRYVRHFGVQRLLEALDISHLVTINDDHVSAPASGEHSEAE